MQIKNSTTRYGIVNVAVHWLMAIMIIGMLVLGLYMTGLPISSLKLKLYGWHKECGLLILALAVFRLTWRLTNITPQLSLPLLEKLAAYAVHWALYIIMFAMPITGWLITSAAGLPISFFGLFILPNLIEPNDALRHFFGEVHEFLGYSLIVLIVLHFSAALKHHLINKDDILRRMLP